MQIYQLARKTQSRQGGPVLRAALFV